MTLVKCKYCGAVVGELEGRFKGRCPNRGCRMWLEMSTHVDAGVATGSRR